MRFRVGRFAAPALAAGASLALGLASPAAAAGPHHHTVLPLHARFGVNQSGNWSGYDLGALDSATPVQYTSISGSWTVPTATAHNSGDSENSANWIGLAGGCVNSDCSVSDPTTLIQDGTEQDVSNGVASYSAWWEIIPEPQTTISGFTVGAGDSISSSIVQTLPGLWTITLQDTTRGETFTQQVPYADSGLSAEWITETPTVIGTSGTGEATLPNPSRDTFNDATANGAAVHFTTADEIQLSPSTGVIVATPSAPDPDADGFNVCSYASSCGAPASG